MRGGWGILLRRRVSSAYLVLGLERSHGRPVARFFLIMTTASIFHRVRARWFVTYLRGSKVDHLAHYYEVGDSVLPARVAIARSPRAPRSARWAEELAQSPRAFRRLAERQGPGATRPRLAHHGSALIANALMFFKQRKNTRDSGQIWTAGLARGFKRCTRTLKRGARKRVWLSANS